MPQIVLNYRQRVFKRGLDLIIAILGLFLTWWIIVIAAVISGIETKSSGFFLQERVGRHGKIFKLIKIKTMFNLVDYRSVVTTSNDPRITHIGRVFRKTKIDELPQLINVLVGHMSIVGPRPDVPGFADKLKGEDRYLLELRPGITGPASIKYRNEEEILSKQNNPEFYNKHVIYPDKVSINLKYIKEYKLANDIKYIYRTITK